MKESMLQRNVQEIRKASSLVRAINHPLRQQMLELIMKHGHMMVTDIYAQLNLEQPIASQHLAVLRQAKMVNANRDGRKIYYSVNYPHLEKAITFVQQLVGVNNPTLAQEQSSENAESVLLEF